MTDYYVLFSQFLEALPTYLLNGLLATSLDHAVSLTDVECRVPVKRFAGHARAVTCCEWSGPFKMAATGGADGLILLWNPYSGRPLATLAKHDAPLVGLCLSERDHVLISADTAKVVKVRVPAGGGGWWRLGAVWWRLRAAP